MSLEQLQRFCSDDEGRPVLRAPYSFEHAGEMWSVGTDGLRMLAIRARLVDPRAEAPNAAHILTIVDGSRDMGLVDLAALAAFVGAPLEPRICTACKAGRVKCDACDGDGEEECECECGHEHGKLCFACRGAGYLTCVQCAGWRTPVRPDCRVLIGDAMFDRALVAICLVDAERTTGTASLVQCGETGISALVGDGWRLIFMPLRQDSADLKAKMPRFPLASESVVAIPDSGRGAA